MSNGVIMPDHVREACRRTLSRLGPSVVTALLFVGLVAAPTSAQPDGVTIDRTTTRASGVVVDISVPRADSGRTLPVTAFDVQVGDSSAAFTVDRLVDQPVVLDLVLGPLVTPEAVAQVQGAVAEFAAQIDPATRVRLAVGDTATDYGQDRTALLAGLQGVAPVAPSSAEAYGALLSAVLTDELEGVSAPEGAVRVAVIYADVDARSVLSSGATTEDLVVDGEYSAGIDERFRTIVERRPPTDGSSVLATFDDIAWSLRSSYRIAVPTATAGQNLSVQVTGLAGPTRATVAVPEPETGSGDRAASTTAPTAPSLTDVTYDAQQAEPVGGDPELVADVEGTRSLLPLLIGGGVLVAVLAGVLAVIVRRRRTPDTVPAPETTREPAQPVPPSSTAGAPSHEWFEPEPVDVTTAPPEMFSNAPEPPLAVTPVFEHTEALPLPPAPPVFSSTENLNADPRVLRAAASAERAVLLLRTFRRDRPEPMPRALAVAIEAAASGWLENHSVTPDEVVNLLEDGRPNAADVTRVYADGLVDMLDGPRRSVWDLALDFAEHLGHRVQRPAGGVAPAAVATLLDEATAVVALDGSDFVGRLGGVVGRGLLSTWPARSGLMDAVPLIVSPSLAAAGGRMSGVEPADVVVALLLAIEDAALRMLRSEQAIADLQQRSTTQLTRDPSGSKLASKASAPTIRLDVHERGPQLVAFVLGHPLVTPADVAVALDVPPGEAVGLVMSLAERGWLRRLDAPDVGAEQQRWLAQQVIEVATRPFAPDYSPRDPNPIDLTTSTQRSVQHVPS